MNSKDFLQKMMAVGEKKSASTDFINVAKMIIKTGYSGFLTGHRPIEFFRSYDNPDESIVDGCIASVAELLQSAGSKRGPVFAFLFYMPLDTNTAEKVTWNIEQVEMMDNKADTDDKVNTYQVFTSAIAGGEFPLNEWFWGSYKNIKTGEYTNDKGEIKPSYTSVPVEVFASEAEAKAMLDSSSNVAKPNSQWSDTLRANHPDISMFEENFSEIAGSNEKIQKGELPWTDAPPLPKPATAPKLKAYLANLYDCAPDDIDIVLASVIPF